jgi:predicted hotdog family 3-hydroxylacyl-ACP dehydratase
MPTSSINPSGTGPLGALTLTDVLPHRKGMLLVDEVIEVDSQHAVIQARVDPAWPLQRPGGVAPLILVEIAAQAAGVCNGWDRIRTQGIDSDQMGWLVAVKKAEFFTDLLPHGAIITARAENTYNFANLREISCELDLDDQPAGRAVLQLFQLQDQQP